MGETIRYSSEQCMHLFLVRAYVQPSALPLIRFTLVVWTCEQPTDDDIVDAVTAPAESRSSALSNEEEEKEGESTATGFRNFAALSALGVSDSDEAQISLLSVEQFVMSKGRSTTQMTMDYFFKAQ